MGKKKYEIEFYLGIIFFGMLVFNLSNVIVGSGIFGFFYVMVNIGIVFFIIFLMFVLIFFLYFVYFFLKIVNEGGFLLYE